MLALVVGGDDLTAAEIVHPSVPSCRDEREV